MTSPLHAAVPVGAPASVPDAELARRAALGDDTAFEAVMRRHNRLLFRTARSILKDDAEAEDALQEAYVRAWRALATFRADAKVSTWLVRIVVNEALGRLRQRAANVVELSAAAQPDANEPSTEASMPDNPDSRPDRMAMRTDARRLIEARIDTLPDVFRTVFVMRAVEELSVEEVAAALQLPEATVRTRYFRARSLLREGLSQDLDMATSDAFSFDGARCDRIVAGVLTRISQDRSRS